MLDDAIHETVFLGESSPLTCVVDEGRRSPDKGYASRNPKARLHYAIPETRGSSELSDDQHRKFLQERLIRESALVFPSPVICDTLLKAYFQWFHPCFPILDRIKIYNEYKEHTISPLLLQAMLFIGVSLCSDTALNTTGFTNRYQAKGLFYQRAKEIYDVGWETDMLIKIQSLFLLSFWRGGPTEEHDVRFWLGAATSIAQKKGIHVLLVNILDLYGLSEVADFTGRNYPFSMFTIRNYGKGSGGPYMWVIITCQQNLCPSYLCYFRFEISRLLLHWDYHLGSAMKIAKFPN